MEDRQIYEIIMKTQCEEYRQMLLLINKIIRADESLRKASLKQTHEYDIELVHDITMQKEAWVQELDRLSFNVPKTIKLLSDYQFSIYELEKSSIYQQMKLLEGKCQAKIDQLIEMEDQNNPAIIASLNNYKERLELDIKIKEVPPEKRNIFFLKLPRST